MSEYAFKFKQYATELKNDPEFIAEALALKVTEEMLEILEEKGKSQSWLGEKMGVSRAHISKILNAPPNMTFLTLAKIAAALEVEPDILLNSGANLKDQTKPLGMHAGTASINSINSALVATNAGIQTGSIINSAAE